MQHLTRSKWAARAVAGAVAALVLVAGALDAVGGTTAQEPAPAPGQDEVDEALAAAFAAAGVQVDREAGAAAFPARVEILNELLEYLLVLPHGAVHESLFVTEVDPEILAAAMLAVGVTQGSNVDYIAKDPPPTREEVRAGARTHDTVLPRGGETYLYAAWRESAGPMDEETGAFPEETLHFHRVEDLLLDLVRGRTMRRHAWTWLGSRMVADRSAASDEAFAATLTGNLVNVAYFSMGDTLITAALPECTSQTSWRPNVWMLPDRGTEVLLVWSTKRLDLVPEGLRAAIPFAPEPAVDDGGGR